MIVFGAVRGGADGQEGRLSPEFVSTRSLLDKLGVKPGAKVAIVDLDDPDFLKVLRERTSDIARGRPKGRCDLVFMSADTRADLRRLNQVKTWIEPNGAIWVVRPEGRPQRTARHRRHPGRTRRGPRRQQDRELFGHARRDATGLSLAGPAAMTISIRPATRTTCRSSPSSSAGCPSTRSSSTRSR